MYTLIKVCILTAPVIFKKKINYVLKEYLDNFIIVYLNNIIIYLNSKNHIKKYILVVIKKYKFYTKKTNFIGFIIPNIIKLKQISINLKKVKAIVN